MELLIFRNAEKPLIFFICFYSIRAVLSFRKAGKDMSYEMNRAADKISSLIDKLHGTLRDAPSPQEFLKVFNRMAQAMENLTGEVRELRREMNPEIKKPSYRPPSQEG